MALGDVPFNSSATDKGQFFQDVEPMPTEVGHKSDSAKGGLSAESSSPERGRIIGQHGGGGRSAKAVDRDPQAGTAMSG